jgi:hypothetical protein
MKLKFGKYKPTAKNPKGIDICFINSGYLKWISDQDWFIAKFPKEMLAVQKELEDREFSHSHFYEDKVNL